MEVFHCPLHGTTCNENGRPANPLPCLWQQLGAIGKARTPNSRRDSPVPPAHITLLITATVIGSLPVLRAPCFTLRGMKEKLPGPTSRSSSPTVITPRPEMT